MKENPVTFKSKGEQIVGMLHLNKKKSPAIILLHGWAGDKIGGSQYTFVRTAREFCKKGFSVLRFDFRGAGDSEGLFKNYDQTSSLEDLNASIRYLKRKLNSKRKKFGVLGWSMGGTTAILGASKKDNSIDCIVGWATPANYEDIWTSSELEQAKKNGGHYYPYPGVWASWKNMKDDLRHNVTRIIKNVHVPILFIHGTKDRIVPTNHATRLYDNFNGTKKIVLINGAGHDFLGEQEKIKLLRESILWFKKYLE